MSNTFNDGTTIATVANMNDLIFRGNIDETEVGRIHEGMPVKITLGALQNMEFDAQLEYISPKGVEEKMVPTNLRSKQPSQSPTVLPSVPDIAQMRKSFWHVPARYWQYPKVLLSLKTTLLLYTY